MKYHSKNKINIINIKELIVNNSPVLLKKFEEEYLISVEYNTYYKFNQI